MEKIELLLRLKSLIKEPAIQKALDEASSIRSRLVDRIDISKVYEIRLKHMEEISRTKTNEDIRLLLKSLESVIDSRVRLSIFNDAGNYYAIFTDTNLNRILGIIESHKLSTDVNF